MDRYNLNPSLNPSLNPDFIPPKAISTTPHRDPNSKGSKGKKGANLKDIGKRLLVPESTMYKGMERRLSWSGQDPVDWLKSTQPKPTSLHAIAPEIQEKIRELSMHPSVSHQSASKV